VIFRARAAAFLLLTASLVRAQGVDTGPEGRLKGLTLEQLGDIEVTSVSKGPVKVTQTPAAVYVITQDDIRRSGVRSLPEALRLAPGVDVAQIDSVKWAVGIRGFESRLSRAVLVLIDGRSVYSPLFHGVYWEVQDTLLKDVDRIEVIRGPGATIWGANAVNGVINIITKNARDTRGAYALVGGGSVEQGHAAFRYGGGNDKGFNYRAYVQGTDQGPEYHSDNRNFDDWRRIQGGFRSDWDINQRDSLTLQGDIYSGVAGESVRITSLTPPSSTVVDQNANLSGGNILMRWQRMLSSTSNIQIQGYYDRVNRLQSSQAEYRNTFDVDFIHHLAIGERQDFIYGFEVRESPASVPTIVPTYVFNPNERTDQVYTAYAQDTVQILPDRLALTIGTKLLHSSFSGFDVEPSVRALWTPNRKQTLWAGITRAVRTPSDIEDTLTNTAFLSSSPSSIMRTTGDGRFTSETLLGYEVGYRSLLARTFSLDIATFYNRYNHLLSLEPGTPYSEVDGGLTTTVYPFQNANGIEGTTKGFEITPDWKPKDWWRLQGSFSFLTMDMMPIASSNDTVTASTLIRSSPRRQGRLQSYFDIGKKIEFSATWRYVSSIPLYQVNGYQTGDLRFAWRFLRNVEFAVTGQNLLQPRHAEFGGDPGPLVSIKRNIFASLSFHK
jgi:iron complex outermembrane receptor protein